MKKFRLILVCTWLVVTLPLNIMLWALFSVGLYLIDRLSPEHVYDDIVTAIDDAIEYLFGDYRDFIENGFSKN